MDPFIGRLHFDLLVDIMLQVVEETSEDDPQAPQVNTTTTSFALATVCSRWRSVALSSPLLWRRIDLHSGTRSETLALALHRSQDAPLIVSINFIRMISPDDLSALLAHSSRWQVACLGCLSDEALEMISGLRHRLQALQELTLDIHLGPEVSPGADVFCNAPSLRNLRLYGPTPPSWLLLPLTQITSVDLLHQTFKTVNSIWVQTPNLVKCQIHLYDSEFTQTRRPSSVVTLSHLVSLTLGERGQSYSASSYVPVLSHLQLPALQHITFSTYGETLHKEFMELLSRSQCSIRSITIEQHLVTYESTMICLNAISASIESISTPMGSDIFRILDSTSFGQPNLPHLKHLHLFCGVLLFNAEVCQEIEQFICKKRSPDSSGSQSLGLRSVTLDQVRVGCGLLEWQETIIPRLMSLSEPGFGLKLMRWQCDGIKGESWY